MRLFTFLFVATIAFSVTYILTAGEPTVIRDGDCVRLSNQPDSVCAPYDRAAKFAHAFGQ